MLLLFNDDDPLAIVLGPKPSYYAPRIGRETLASPSRCRELGLVSSRASIGDGCVTRDGVYPRWNRKKINVKITFEFNLTRSEFGMNFIIISTKITGLVRWFFIQNSPNVASGRVVCKIIFTLRTRFGRPDDGGASARLVFPCGFGLAGARGL